MTTGLKQKPLIAGETMSNHNMKDKVAQFIVLIDEALAMVTEMLSTGKTSNAPEDLDRTSQFLKKIKTTAAAGQLEPSQGIVTLGLSRGVTEWLEPPDSPLYPAIGAIEKFYRDHL
jgi:hypothetical protein